MDELLTDLDLQIGSGTRFARWLGPVNPRSCRRVLPRLLGRLERG